MMGTAACGAAATTAAPAWCVKHFEGKEPLAVTAVNMLGVHCVYTRECSTARGTPQYHFLAGKRRLRACIEFWNHSGLAD
jgi:hypothetical protein